MEHQSFLAWWLSRQLYWRSVGYPADRSAPKPRKGGKKVEKRFAPRPPSQTQENPLEELPTDVVTDTLPVLCHMLWDVRWDDGSARKPSTITIFRQDDKFKACLSDKDSGMVCFITGETLQACLTEMEYHAANGDLPWRKQLDGQGGTQRIPRK